MNQELSIILRNRLTSLPFVQVLAGMAQVVTKEIVTESGAAGGKERFPVSYEVLGVDNCKGKEYPLTPDSSKKSIIYFEDFGCTPGNIDGAFIEYTSNIRLVCWLNRMLLTGNAFTQVTAVAVNSILRKLHPANPINIGIFTRLVIKPTKVHPQNENIFSQYTYDVTTRQQFRPPFECFAIDLSCSYRIGKDCINHIDFNTPSNCNV